MALPARHALCAAALIALSVNAVAQQSSPLESIVADYINSRKDAVCKQFKALPKTSCVALAEAAAKKAVGAQIDEKALEATIKKDFEDPALLNSALATLFGGRVPIGLEFKALNSKQMGESVLGLSFNADQSIFKSEVSASGDWRKQTALSFGASGTVVNDGAKNPRNFVQINFNAGKSFTTNIPDQDEAFANRLTDLSLKAAVACQGPGAAATDACARAKAAPYKMLDQTTDFLKSFRRYKAALDFGYETDQALDAKQSTFGVSFFGQFENWGPTSGIGRVTPAFRVALDKVNPNDQTPRALAGDRSSYYRVSGELSLWVPLGNYQGQHFVFTINYRSYWELSPSAIVKNANLDTYTLRTVSLTSPTGLLVSYSSGKLPFDQQSDDVVALGWRTYF